MGMAKSNSGKINFSANIPDVVKEYVLMSLKNENNSPVVGAEWYRKRLNHISTSEQMDILWPKLEEVLDEGQLTEFIYNVSAAIPHSWRTFGRGNTNEITEVMGARLEDGKLIVAYFKGKRPSEIQRKSSLTEISSLALKVNKIFQKYPTILKEVITTDKQLASTIGSLDTLSSVADLLRTVDRAKLNKRASLTMPRKNVVHAEQIHFHQELSLFFYEKKGSPFHSLVADVTNAIFENEPNDEFTESDVSKAFGSIIRKIQRK